MGNVVRNYQQLSNTNRSESDQRRRPAGADIANKVRKSQPFKSIFTREAASLTSKVAAEVGDFLYLVSVLLIIYALGYIVGLLFPREDPVVGLIKQYANIAAFVKYFSGRSWKR